MDTLLSYLLRFAVGGGVYVDAAMAANYTIDLTIGTMSPHFYNLAPASADRQIILPDPAATLIGVPFLVSNSAAGGGYNVLVRGKTLTYTGTLSSASTIGTIPPGVTAYAICYDDGTYFRWKYQALSSADALTLTGALTAVGITSTGAVTTTDGVASGVARKVGGTASVAVASTTLGPTGGTAENTIGTYTILANTFKAGTLARLFAAVRCTAETGATTCTFRLKLGGTTLFTSAAVDLAAGDVFNFDMNIVSRAAPSASSALVVAGSLTAVGASTDVSKAIALAAANYATNGALALVLTAQMSASDANAISCDMYNVELVG